MRALVSVVTFQGLGTEQSSFWKAMIDERGLEVMLEQPHTVFSFKAMSYQVVERASVVCDPCAQPS